MATRNSSSANKLSDVEHHLVHIASTLWSIRAAANELAANDEPAFDKVSTQKAMVTLQAAIENVGASADSALKMIGCSQVVGSLEDWVGLPK